MPSGSVGPDGLITGEHERAAIASFVAALTHVADMKIVATVDATAVIHCHITAIPCRPS